MTQAGFRLAGVLAVTLGVAALAFVALPSLLGAAASDGGEGECISLAKEVEETGFTVPIDGRDLVVPKVSLSRLVWKSLDAEHAELRSTLDVHGTLGKTEVTALGSERTGFVRRNSRWTLDGALTPRLNEVVSRLERRRRVLESGEASEAANLQADPDAGFPDELKEFWSLKRRAWKVTRWSIRLEREGAVVTEDAVLEGDGQDAPESKHRARRLELVQTQRGLLFAHGIM